MIKMACEISGLVTELSALVVSEASGLGSERTELPIFYWWHLQYRTNALSSMKTYKFRL